MKLPIQLGLAGLLSGAALAQTKPDVTEILGKLSETYKAAQQYEIVADRVEKDPATGESEGAHMLIAVRLPDRYRIERAAIAEGSGGKDSKGINIVVLDGAAIWFYDSDLNQYTSAPAASIGKDLPDELKQNRVDDSAMSRFRTARDSAAKARFLREEEVQVGGARIACFVLSVPEGEAEYTWWIDRKSNHVVREDDSTSMTIFTTVKLGEALPENLFKFNAPAGASKSGPGRR